MREANEVRQMISDGLLDAKHSAPWDPDFGSNLKSLPWQDWMINPANLNCTEKYLQTIHDWLHASQSVSVQGLSRFKHRDLIYGTTQSFDEAYYEFADLRLRIFRGEYAYHARTGFSHRVEFLDDEEGNYLGFKEGDWCVVSLPFCGDGDIHSHWKTMLDDALEKKIPVVVDGAWLGTCSSLNLDYNHPAITSVSFSLSKGLGMGKLRTGIRYSSGRHRRLPVAQQNAFNHLPVVAAYAGIHQMEKFSVDHLSQKYARAYAMACEASGLTPTPCVHIALAPDDEIWDSFLVDGLYRRVGVWNLVEKYAKEEGHQ